MKNIYEILSYVAVRRTALLATKAVVELLITTSQASTKKTAESFALILDADIRLCEQLEKDLQQFKNNHLPDSIHESLNAGDGTYRP